MYTRMSLECQTVGATSETGSVGKEGGNQTTKQVELGSILAVFSETIQLVDDFEVLNNLNTKDGANTNRRYICRAVKICERPTYPAQANDWYLRS